MMAQSSKRSQAGGVGIARGLVVLVWVLVGSAQGAVAPLDLNDFSFFLGDPVTIAPDGSSATIGESTEVDPIQLVNDPVSGDPAVIVSGAGNELVFDYDFVEAAGEDDEFGVFILDPDTGDSAGSAFEFFTSDSGIGSVSFDLSPLAGVTELGLLFQLAAGANDTGVGSSVTVSNLRIQPIPEPGSAMVLALLGLGAWGRRTSRAEGRPGANG